MQDDDVVVPVFVHGAGSNAGFWHEQRAAFPHGHYINLPGHSDVRGVNAGVGMQSVDDYANWLIGYLGGQNFRRVVLNGHSMGGAIVQTVALRQPEWLVGLVLTGTGARLRVLPQLLELLRTDYPAAVDLIIERSFAPPTGPLTYGQKARLNGTRRQILRTPREVTLGDYTACDSYDAMDRLSEIRVPTLCVVGAQDQMTPPRYSDYLHSHIEGSRLAVIEGAGHMLPLEKPAEYNRVLAEFIATL